jgi:HPt (histidine-containing phosphotransfer) domain-containing protein
VSDVLDSRMIDALRAFGPEPGKLLREMLRDFLMEAPSLMEEVERAASEEAYAGVAGAAHQLRGSGGHIGALRLAAVAGEVEASARARVRSATSAATTSARTELDLAVVAARELLTG